MFPKKMFRTQSDYVIANTARHEAIFRSRGYIDETEWIVRKEQGPQLVKQLQEMGLSQAGVLADASSPFKSEKAKK